MVVQWSSTAETGLPLPPLLPPLLPLLLQLLLLW